MAWPLDKTQLMQMYRTMTTIRIFEEKSVEVSRRGLTPGRMHPYMGEEAVAVGVCSTLKSKDLVVSSHRGGGHLLAMGGDPHRMFAEYCGRATGYGHGRGGPMHLSAPEIGFLTTTGIVGSGITLAAGMAMAILTQHTGQVVACFFGDGASNTGSFHEGLNVAAIWKLPVIYICENNQYGETMPIGRAIAIPDIASRAAAYGMPGHTVDGNDVAEVHEVAEEAVAWARHGNGPVLIEAKTYRYGGHFDGESQHYRSREEIQAWRQKDPIVRFEAWLLAQGQCAEDDLKSIQAQAREEINLAAQMAENDPFPPMDDLENDVRLPLAWEAQR